MNLITHHACMDSMTYAPTRSSVRADTATTQLVVGTEPAFDFASAEYRVLHQRSRASAFQGAHWLAGLHHDIAPAVDAEPFTVGVRDAADGHPVEVDARWSSLPAWSPHGDLHLFGLHAAGAFAVLSLPDARPADECAALARAAGTRVIAPRRLRDAGPGWEAAGAAAAWQRLVEALGVEA